MMDKVLVLDYLYECPCMKVVEEISPPMSKLHNFVQIHCLFVIFFPKRHYVQPLYTHVLFGYTIWLLLFSEYISFSISLPSVALTNKLKLN